MTDVATAQDVVAFWHAAGPDRWFEKDEAFDEACRERFLLTYEAAARGMRCRNLPMHEDVSIRIGYRHRARHCRMHLLSG